MMFTVVTVVLYVLIFIVGGEWIRPRPEPEKRARVAPRYDGDFDPEQVWGGCPHCGSRDSDRRGRCRGCGAPR